MSSLPPDDQLFAAIAVQLDFLNATQLQEAIDASNQSGETLQQSLTACKLLEQQDCDAIGEVVKRQIARHNGDTEATLATERIAQTLSLIEGLDHTIGQAETALNESSAGDSPAPTHESASRYNKVSEHAQGGLGQVFIARDTQIGRDVALKEIKSPHERNASLRQRFMLEAEVTGRLEHPGVVPIYGLGTYEDGRPYYAMRFIHGQSLRAAIDELHGRKNASQVATLTSDGVASANHASQHGGDSTSKSGRFDELTLHRLLSRFVGVCNAIGYAHSRGVLHRDLKPENIMLGEYGETLVVDWGIAKVLGDAKVEASDSETEPAANQSQTRAGAIVGTPAYMSPEQAAGQSVSPASDIYSLGATLYAILVGGAPITGSATDVIQRVAAGDIPPVREINSAAPKALEAICKKAMAKDSRDRYTTCSALADDIEAYLAGEAVSAWNEPLSIRAARWVRKHRTMATSIVVGITVLTVASIVGMILLGSAYRAEKEAKDLAAQRADDLKIANEKEVAARNLADERLLLGRQAVDQYLVSVTDDPGLMNAGFEPLRTRLLNGAGEFYAVLNQKDTSNPALQHEQAWAQLKLAEINSATGKLAKAEKLFQEAADSFEKLVKKNSSDHESREALAMALQNRAVALEAMGRLPEAETDLQNSTVHLNTLAEQLPTPRHILRTQADNINIQGNWAFHREEFTKASELFEAEGEIRQKIIADSTEADPQDIVRMASVFSNTGHIAMQENRFADAQNAYDRAAAYYDDLTRRFADHIFASSYQKRHAESLRELGDVKQAQGEFAEALALYEQAANQLQKLVARQPAIVEYQQDLAMVRNNIATNYVRSGQNDAAKTNYAAAIEAMNRVIQQRPDNVRDRKFLASYLVNAASLYMTMQLYDDAETALLRAAKLFEALANDEPEVQVHNVKLAVVYVELASLYQTVGNSAAGITAIENSQEILAGVDAAGDAAAEIAETKGKGFHVAAMIFHSQAKLEQAAANYDQAIAARRASLKQSNQSDDAKTALAASLGSRSRVDVDGDEVNRETITRVTEAIELLAAVRSSQPTAVLPMQFTLTCYGILASAHRQLKEIPQAKAALEQALAIAPAEGKIGVQLLQLNLFGKIGDADALNELADNMRKTSPVQDNPWLLVQVADAYGLAVGSIKGNRELPATRRDELAAAMLKQAIETLNQGEEVGGFVTRENAIEALAGEGFNSIRDRQEFKEYMSKYEMKTP